MRIQVYAARLDDPNSNRLSSISINATDTDKDGLYETAEQRKNTTRLLNIQPSSNKLQGFTQTLTTITGTKTNSTVASQINYTLDANGNLTSDGLREFQYDGSDRLSKVILGTTFVGTDSIAGNELAAHTYLHNAAGQRVFKSEPKTETTVPNSTTLGTEFVSWLQTNYSWLWSAAQTNATLGDSYLYADGQLPSWALLGEYGNGGASSTGRTEYIWLPTSNGQAIPIGMLRAGKLIAIHSDHLGTPRLMVDSTNTPVWQWAYSAFGDNAPTGILKPTTAAASAFISTPAGSNGNTSVTLLATSSPAQINNLRFPRQFADSETGLFYNYFRSYQPNQGRYTQNDPIGLDGGLNRSIYVDANPMSFTDPDGLKGRPSRGRSTASDAAGYHDPRGNLVCEQWTCPSSSSMCMQGDQKRPTDFLPVATTEAPRGCSCTRYAYRPDWRPPNQDISDDWNRTRDLLGDAYNTHRDAKDQAPRFNNGLGRLPHWHRLGGYGK